MGYQGVTLVLHFILLVKPDRLSLVLCDHEGTVLAGENTVEISAFMIHSRLHLYLPNANIALHTHMPYATSVTLLQNGRLEMCEQNALMYHNRIAYDDDYNGLASHGVIVTGPSVAQEFTDLYYLERASMFQVLARATGKALRVIENAVVEKTSAQFLEKPRLGKRYFGALRRILEKEEPDYKS